MGYETEIKLHSALGSATVTTDGAQLLLNGIPAAATAVPQGYTSGAINAAIAKVLADSGGVGGIVQLVSGQYTCTSTITLPSKVTLRGTGKQTTVLMATKDMVVLDVIGQAGGVNGTGGINGHIASPIIENLAIDGGTNAAWSTQPMTRFYYVHTGEISSVKFQNKYGIATLLGAEVWDTTWRECRWDNCGGTNQGLPCMLIQSADGATFPAFGSSTDATNDQRFYHCTWESFRDGAVWTANPTGANPVGNLYFWGCKADQNQTALGDWFRFEGVQGVYMHDWDFSSYLQGAAWNSTPFAMVTLKACKGVTLKGWTHNQNSAATDCLIHFDGTGLGGNGNHYVVVDDINVVQIGSGSTSFATGIVRVTGTNLNYRFQFLSYPRYMTTSPLAIKPIFSLTAGTATYPKADIFMPIDWKAGAFTVATDIGTQEPGVPTGVAVILGVDTTNNTLSILYPDGVTIKKATLA